MRIEILKSTVRPGNAVDRVIIKGLIRDKLAVRVNSGFWRIGREDGPLCPAHIASQINDVFDGIEKIIEDCRRL